MRALPVLFLLAACAKGTSDPGDEPDARVVVGAPDANPLFVDAMPAPDAMTTMPDAMTTTSGVVDTCVQAMDLTTGANQAGGVTVTGDTTTYANDAEPDTSCTDGFGEDGPDAIYYVNATAGQVLTATVTATTGAFDSAIYVSLMCQAIPVCVIGADAVAGTGPETVTTTLASAGQYYIFVDSYVPSQYGPYSLHVTLQ